MTIPLVIAEPTGYYRRMLRRFTFSASSEGGINCPASDWGHDAHVFIGDVRQGEAEPVHGDNWPHDDPRWPKTCQACGWEFPVCGCGQYRCPAEGEWQRNDIRIYRLPDGTEILNWGSMIRDAPPGTMIRIPWADEHFSLRHPQHVESWLVVLPDGGQWITSQAASSGGYWTVEGTPPNITVSPSIFHNAPTGWHGFIRNGEMSPALPGASAATR